MARLALLFILVPAGELALLIEVGGRIGVVPTVAVIVATGILGAALARAQGLSVLLAVQRDLAEGRLPTVSLVDGAIVLVSGALLLTPGFLTDVVGFLGLVPAVRAGLRRWLWRRFERAIEQGQIHVTSAGPRAPGSPYDADFRSLD